MCHKHPELYNQNSPDIVRPPTPLPKGTKIAPCWEPLAYRISLMPTNSSHKRCHWDLLLAFFSLIHYATKLKVPSWAHSKPGSHQHCIHRPYILLFVLAAFSLDKFLGPSKQWVPRPSLETSYTLTPYFFPQLYTFLCFKFSTLFIIRLGKIPFNHHLHRDPQARRQAAVVTMFTESPLHTLQGCY